MTKLANDTFISLCPFLIIVFFVVSDSLKGIYAASCPAWRSVATWTPRSRLPVTFCASCSLSPFLTAPCGDYDSHTHYYLCSFLHHLRYHSHHPLASPDPHCPAMVWAERLWPLHEGSGGSGRLSLLTVIGSRVGMEWWKEARSEVITLKYQIKFVLTPVLLMNFLILWANKSLQGTNMTCLSCNLKCPWYKR